jgi:4-hydroxybenzoate polyprenyltransferase
VSPQHQKIRNEELKKNIFLQKLNDFSELVMFKHSVFSLPFIFIAMLVASCLDNGTGWFGWKLLFLGTLAAVTARNFAMGVNRYLDRDIDILNPRTKNRPSVDGRVSDMQMLGFIIVNAIAFIVVAYFVNALALKLSLPILIVLGAYTVFKRFSALAHLILGVSLGLAPIAGVVAVSGEVTLWSVYLATGVMFWVAGFDLLYSLQDMEFDKKHNLHSIPSRFGAQNTMRIARVFHLLTVWFWWWFAARAGLGIWAQTAVLFSAVMLGYEHYLVNKDFTKIDKAFFTVNGYLGFVFLILIILEVVSC